MTTRFFRSQIESRIFSIQVGDIHKFSKAKRFRSIIYFLLDLRLGDSPDYQCRPAFDTFAKV